MKRYLAFTFCVALVYANSSLAGNINYNYIELGYVETDWDNDAIDDDADGYEFNASLAVAQTLAIEIGYQDVEFDNADGNLQGIGIAYHKPYSNTGDMILGLSYLNQEVEPDSGSSSDESGNSIRLEVRNQKPGSAEYSFSLVRVEIDGESDSGYNFGIVTGNPQGFQFVIDYTDLDSISSLTLGLRSSF